MRPLRPTWSFIIAAAGEGSRVGGTPKQFRDIGGRKMWVWSAMVAEELYSRGGIDELIVVFPRDFDKSEAEETENFGIPVRYEAGGATRNESVKNGVKRASSEYVMIHVAARPFLSPELCEALIAGSSDSAGAIPLIGSADSLKSVDGKIRAIPRDKIFRTQTPQAFKRSDILRVLESAASPSTDEATLWIEAGLDLVWVPGSEKNFKITTDFDLAIARAMLDESRIQRVGIGYDVHELVPGRKLVLGGVEFDSPLGLLGHSDADIICHAISDALLGASGEGDIGTMFPASDEAYKGADSTVLLRSVLDLLLRKKWSVINVDVTLAAQVPRFGDSVQKITYNLKTLFMVHYPRAELSVKVKSGVYVGSVGRAECMTGYAAALIEGHCLR
ncbi:MAG: 2-C-methyl-D-erythritol 2,4-cyclodiphosphate synthase [Synergistaceae bacterium]|jgi:2-C-methyl-D-erythritol 4-phosphate cytidylyltransferase/2-C-methyl-D-erythritol 2,4-cyclodiphosphate synthase|nr:2-C-methyl-D-erythritol 2,4-cyclodiphosphate synthase [Synergistaceae bacterium]